MNNPKTYPHTRALDMKKLIYVIALLAFPILGIGQNSDENYVKTTVYLEETAPSEEAQVAPSRKIEQISYYDALGRPKQSIVARGGGQSQNIVTYQEYDGFGRSPKGYLPYATDEVVSGDPLLLMDQAILKSNIGSFYATPKYEGTLNPYTEMYYENSPLNRVLEQGAPGNSWAINTTSDSDHTIKFDYQTNAALEVVHYKVVFENGDSRNPQLIIKNYYGPGQLAKSITKDENWTPASGNDRTIQEFTNKEGQVVLKRSFDANIPHDTYYVYDDFGNLTFVLPPVLSTQIEANHTIVANANNEDEYVEDYSISWPISDFMIAPETQSGSVIFSIENQVISLTVLGSSVNDFTMQLREQTIKELETNIPIENQVVGNVYGIHNNNPDTPLLIGVFSILDGNLVLDETGGGALPTFFNLFSFDIETPIVFLQDNPIAIDFGQYDDLAYQYIYDHRNRLTDRKIPGKNWEYIVYDKLDRPILTQDAYLRANNQWLFTKFDEIGRVAYTGIYTDIQSRSSIQNEIDITSAYTGAASPYNEQALDDEIMIDGISLFYSNDRFPSTNLELLTVNYYDRYVDAAGMLVPATVYGVNTITNAHSLPTVGKVRVLDTDDWITTITGYDEKARPIYVQSINTFLDTNDTVTRLDIISLRL